MTAKLWEIVVKSMSSYADRKSACVTHVFVRSHYVPRKFEIVQSVPS